MQSVQSRFRDAVEAIGLWLIEPIGTCLKTRAILRFLDALTAYPGLPRRASRPDTGSVGVYALCDVDEIAIYVGQWPVGDSLRLGLAVSRRWKRSIRAALQPPIPIWFLTLQNRRFVQH